jgi:hypothetical protein
MLEVLTYEQWGDTFAVCGLVVYAIAAQRLMYWW